MLNQITDFYIHMFLATVKVSFKQKIKLSRLKDFGEMGRVNMVELPDGSIEKVIKEINTEDLRNSREMGNLLNILKKKKQYLQIEKQKLNVVICCSVKDEKIGAAVKEILATLEIGSFVAHDGSDLPEKVTKRIIGELGEFNAFIPLLSTNFKNSDYCSQELGVAYFKKLLIIPLSLDGTIPYGFISGFRSYPISGNNVPMGFIMKLIADQYPTADITGKLINALKEVKSIELAEDIMKTLVPYFDKLSDEEISSVIDISIENNHVPASCRKEYLPGFIEINRAKIEKDKLELVMEIIKENNGVKHGSAGVKILDQENE